MRSYIDRGYTVVKKKIGGASLDEDLRRIDSILAVLLAATAVVALTSGALAQADFPTQTPTAA
jgi:hypothetical protein